MPRVRALEVATPPAPRALEDDAGDRAVVVLEVPLELAPAVALALVPASLGFRTDDIFAQSAIGCKILRIK